MKKIIRRWLDSGVRVFRQENQGYYQAYITIIFSRLAHPYHKHAFLICDKILLKQRLSHMYQLQYGYPRRLNREGKGCRATLSRSGNKYFATWSCKKGEIQQQSILPKPKNYANKAKNYAKKKRAKNTHTFRVGSSWHHFTSTTSSYMLTGKLGCVRSNTSLDVRFNQLTGRDNCAS